MSGSTVTVMTLSALPRVSPSVRSLTGNVSITCPSPSTRPRAWPSRAASAATKALRVPLSSATFSSKVAISILAATIGTVTGTSGPDTFFFLVPRFGLGCAAACWRCSRTVPINADGMPGSKRAVVPRSSRNARPTLRDPGSG